MGEVQEEKNQANNTKGGNTPLVNPREPYPTLFELMEQPLVTPRRCRGAFCNLVTANEEDRLIRGILKVVYDLFNNESWSKNKHKPKVFRDAVYRALMRKPEIVKFYLFSEGVDIRYKWRDQELDKKGVVKKIEVDIMRAKPAEILTDDFKGKF